MTETVAVPEQRRRPWEGVGLHLDKQMTAKEAVVAGGLDWDVAVEPAYRKAHSGKMHEVDGQFWVVKQDDEYVLGKVTDRYVPFQNREAFEFADNLVDSGDGKYVQVGPLRKNRVIFLVMQVPKDIVIADVDQHDLHIIFTTSHDGSKAIGAFVAMTKLSCTNQLTFFRRTAPHSWSIPHVADVKGKVAAARDSLAMSFAYADEFAEIGTKLAGTKLRNQRLHNILEDSLPRRPKTEEVIQSIEDLYRNSNTNGFGGTAWGALNAVTEYFDHKRDTRSNESVFFGAVAGDPARIRNAVAQKLVALM
jgi:phage/plasmid-like protein (TIGR03299 family)